MVQNVSRKETDKNTPAAPGLLDAMRRAEMRTGDAFELVPIERLDAGERAGLGRRADDPDLYGVLRPRQGGGTYKTVGGDLALLWFTLREPGPLPAFVRRGASLATLTELVLDGVFELVTRHVAPQ